MDAGALARGVIAGERRALARAITLVESRRPDHRETAGALLAEVTRTGRQALRVGLSGTPGVGKSTFVEALGLHLTGAGQRLAVLAVDPSSARTGGSILGDKTRMERLAREPAAFIRPSPAQSTLGGVARRTREAVALCEGWGADVVLVETVGVGQSEVQVAQMVDVFVLLLAPGGGDELQGVKRGIMEIADILLVNRADGPTAAQARATAADYAGALHLMRARPQDPPGYPLVRTVSARSGAGIAEAWKAVTDLARWRQEAGIAAKLRAAQARHWFGEELRAEVMTLLSAIPAVRDRIAELDEEVAAGRIAPSAAAAEALAPLRKGTVGS